jgi:septal ring factor EnvC (AmiA/AmiB activator)
MAENEKKCPCDNMVKVQADIEAQNKRLAQGDTNFKLLEYQLKTINEGIIKMEQTLSDKINEMKTDVNCLKEKPAKRWDGLVDRAIDKLISLASLGILAYIANMIAK